jgi:acyl carrier protein
VDTVILNSVVQYFPGEGYLSAVLGRAVGCVGERGRVVVGDVRDLRLLGSMRRRLELEKAEGGLSLREWEWQVEQGVLREEELCIGPDYFYGFKELYREIGWVGLEWKGGGYDNELSRYRYNVVLYIGEWPVLRPEWRSWGRKEEREGIWRELEAGVERIAVKGVPNPRLEVEWRLREGMESGVCRTVGELRRYAEGRDGEMREVEEMLKRAEELGYGIRRLVSGEAMRMDVLLERAPWVGPVEGPWEAGKGEVTNVPMLREVSGVVERELRRMLGAVLPEYMIPVEWMGLRRLPLTGNGKVDRKLLMEQGLESRRGLLAYVGARNETEGALVRIWEEVLGREGIGVEDNFFEIGGHSLVATQVIAHIRKELGVEVGIRELFGWPTVSGLGARIEALRAAGGGAVTGIGVQVRPERVPLSYAQERLWFIDRMEGSVQYHMPVVLRLTGELDREALGWAMGEVVRRHEVLRTVLREAEGRPYQEVREAGLWRMTVEEGVKEEEIQERVAVIVSEPFDLAEDFLVRAHLLGIAAQEQDRGREHVLVVVMHHIVSDGWSQPVLVGEFNELYRSRVEGRAAELPELVVQYADYTLWQRRYLEEGGELERQLGYWQGQLRGLGPLELPADHGRPAVQSTRGATRYYRLEASLV